jgi:hypothetical protein
LPKSRLILGYFRKYFNNITIRSSAISSASHFNDNGDHTDTHVPYDRNDVPAPVTDNVKNNYSGYGNADFTRIDRAGGNSVYQVNLKNKNAHKTVYMDEQGKETKYQDSHR